MMVQMAAPATMTEPVTMRPTITDLDKKDALWSLELSSVSVGVAEAVRVSVPVRVLDREVGVETRGVSEVTCCGVVLAEVGVVEVVVTVVDVDVAVVLVEVGVVDVEVGVVDVFDRLVWVVVSDTGGSVDAEG